MKINKLFPFLISSFCLIACQSEDRREKQKEELEKEIKELTHQITAERMKEMNLEIESQPMMFEEWHEYTKTLDEAEKHEHFIHQLEERIQTLKKQQSDLQKKPA
jgi:ribosomal protein L29